MRMLSKNRTLRLVLLAGPVLALAVAALILAFGPGTGHRAQADSPHAGLDFSLGIDFNGDGTNDCGTGVPTAVGDGAPDAVSADVTSTTCNVPLQGATLNVNVYLMSAGGIAFAGQASQVFYTGITSNGPGDAVWTGCVFEAPASLPGLENVGCAIGLPPAAARTDLGLMTKFVFTCAATGEIHLGHGGGQTALTDNHLVEHREAGPDSLTVNCGGGGGPTPTNTSVPPTPVATTPGPTTAPTTTPTPTNTPGPITPTRTRTPGPTSAAPHLGDVNGDGHITSTDALWILWKEANIVDRLPLAVNADVSQDGRINAVDALFLLWMVGGQVPLPAWVTA